MVVTPDGRVALTVGDAVGHGVAASAVMGQLRSALGASLVSGASAGAALQALDDYVAAAVPDARLATVAVVIVDPDTGQVEYCTAGHPPPLTISAGGDAAFLEPTGAGPLCSGRGYATKRHVLGAGDLVILYSDGLVERPGRTPGESMVEILGVARDLVVGRGVTTARRDPSSLVQRLCGSGVEMLLRTTGAADDVTVLAVQRRHAEVPRLRVDVAAVPDAVRTVRHDLGDWFDELHLDTTERVLLQHVVGELVTNVVEHAYRDTPRGGPLDRVGMLRVAGSLQRDGVLCLSVSDDGSWAPGSDGHDGADGAGRGRGRGLSMVRRIVDDLEVRAGATGTTVEASYRPLRPDGDRTAETPAALAHPSQDDELRISGEDNAIRVAGAIDLLTTPGLVSRLDDALGTDRQVELDLSAVTFLGSSGIRALHDFGLQRLKLVAPAGSVAQHVLDVVGVEHHPE